MSISANSAYLQPLRSVYHDDEVISGILNIFVNNLPNYLHDLQNNLQSSEWSRAAGVCHKLKGTASGYGYPEIALVASDLEIELLDGSRDQATIEQLLDRLNILERRALLSISTVQ